MLQTWSQPTEEINKYFLLTTACWWTQHQRERAKTHQLDISLEWLNSAHETANQQPTAHPITGSNNHFCFFDRFHESNPQKEREVSQRVTHVQQLNGLINTQHQEQLYNVFNR